MMALKTASTPLTAMPRMRKGSSISHIKGYSRSASMASGQQRTNRISQSRNLPIVRLLCENSNLFSVNVKFFLDAICFSGLT